MQPPLKKIALNKKILRARIIFRIFLVFIIYLVAMLLVAITASDLRYLLVFISSTTCISLIFLFSKWLIFLNENPMEICLERTKITMPGIFLVNRISKIDAAKVESVEFISRGGGNILLGLKNRYPIGIERKTLLNIEDFELIYRHLDNWLINSGKKPDCKENALTHSTYATPVACYGIMVTLSLFYLLFSFQYEEGHLTTEILKAGANQKSIIDGDRIFRLFSSYFLHYNFLHFLVNIAGYVIVGPIVEVIFGRIRFLNLVLLGALVGAVLSLLFSSYAYSVGASGGLFALLGAYAALKVFYRKTLPPSLNTAPKYVFLALIIVELIAGFFIDFIDGFAHIGGFLCGYFVGVFVVKRNAVENLELHEGISTLEKFSSGIFLACYAGAGITFLLTL